MSKVHKRGTAKVEMNMTPLIDVTFQLIIFFMLVNNIISKETVQMKPPELENPVTRKLEDVNRVVISLEPRQSESGARDQQPLNWDGEVVNVYVGALVKVGMDQLSVVTDELKRTVDAAPKNPDGQSNLEVVLRADAALYYDEVQQVLGAITEAGVSRINMVALMPEEYR